MFRDRKKVVGGEICITDYFALRLLLSEILPQQINLLTSLFLLI